MSPGGVILNKGSYLKITVGKGGRSIENTPPCRIIEMTEV
jgi:hypothetical protein